VVFTNSESRIPSAKPWSPRIPNPESRITLVLTTTFSYVAAWAIGVPLLVPILNTLASFPFMVAALRRGDLRAAVGRMLLWAMTMGVCATIFAWVAPWQAGQLFIRGDAYRAEMFAWVLSGRGAESTPSQFIPQQAEHAALFTLLALATGGVLAMPMGAVLMNYMGTYVGSLTAASARPAVTLLLGWHPWAIIRIASFVTLGVVCAGPVLSRAFNFRIDWADARRLLAWSCAGLVLDVALKTLLAPAWQRLLLRVIGW
jgi:hypothetical protein